MASRIVIADDHPLVRGAVRAALQPSWPGREVVEVADAAGARAEAERGGVELLTLDLNMADSSGLSTLMALRQDFPEMPVAIVSASEDARTARGARDLGASGFVPKSAPLDVMRAAFAAIAEGDLWFPQGLDEAVEDGADDDAIARLKRLTPAQRRILALVCEGKLNKQIAYEMDISEATVKAHMTAVFRRLGVNNRTQAVLIARQLDDGV